jgi:hypothetical protein
VSAPDEIRLTLPATAGYARVARLTLTGLVSRSGFTYDDVEDVRIAVGELFATLVADAPANGRVRLRCRVEPDALHLVAEAVPPRPLGEVTELTRRILDAVSDRPSIDVAAGRITLVARPTR